MTLLTSNDSRVICRIQLTGEGRWVSLALSLGPLASGTRFLVSSERLVYEMAAVDDMARGYGLSTWQGGIISGARYAFRALGTPLQQVCLHELRGQLGSGDASAVSSAAALAVARLLNRSPEFLLDLGGWTMEEAAPSPPPAKGISQIANSDSSQPGPLQERTKDRSPASENTGTNGGTLDLPAEPGAAADQSRE